MAFGCDHCGRQCGNHYNLTLHGNSCKKKPKPAPTTTSELELCNVKENKIAIPMDRLLNTIHSCHRIGKKCLSVKDTFTNLTTKYEINYNQKSTVILSLVSSAVKTCPFCCKKQFKHEKPVLICWSNGLLYKGYVLSRQGRLCYVELDNFNTAVLDCKDVFDEFEHEVMCTVCKSGLSEPPNEIVLCDCCNSGYHQKCHKPVITEDILCLDEDWFCARCERTKTGHVTVSGGSAEEPQYTLSTLACMALLCLGPSTRSTVRSWIQDSFKYYQKQKSDKWKTKLATTMSITGHWMFMDKNTGLWQLQAHNTPSLLRHLDEVTKRSTDISPNVLDKIRSELKLKTLTSLNLYYDFLPYKTAELTWDAKHRYNEEGVYCYCMGPGVWYKQMLQCLNCRQWFHQACVSCSAKPMLFGENNIFICSVCNLGEEHLTLRALSDRECLQLAMYHVVMTRYRGDFQLPVCLRMNTTPLLQAWDPVRFQDLQVWTLAQTAIDNPDLFQPGAKHKNTTLYRLLVDEPPSFPLDETLTLPLPASHQPIPHYLPPGFVMDLANGTSGLQVDGSPLPEEFPPSQYDISLFKDVDYYGKKMKVNESHSETQTKSGKKRKNSGNRSQLNSTPPTSNMARSEESGEASDQKQRRARTALDEEKDGNPPTNSATEPKSLTIKRLQSGENYQILGKRQGNDGGLEYLIAWEGIKSRCLQRIRRMNNTSEQI